MEERLTVAAGVAAGILLPYPSDNLVLDVVLLLLFLALEALRIFYGDAKHKHLLCFLQNRKCG